MREQNNATKHLPSSTRLNRGRKNVERLRRPHIRRIPEPTMTTVVFRKKPTHGTLAVARRAQSSTAFPRMFELMCSNSILTTAAVVVALTATPGLTKESEERAMNQARQTIDALVERLKNAELSVDKIAHILGSAEFDKNGVAAVRIDSPPFDTASVEEYRRVITIRFTMSDGPWHLKDITEKVNAWSLAPAT